MWPIKVVTRLFLTKHQLKSIHYRNVSTDPTGTGPGSLWIRGAHFGNHCSRGLFAQVGQDYDF